MVYLFFDTETTGLPKNYKAPSTDVDNWPRLVQLSWILKAGEDRELSRGDFVIRPDGFVIPEEASNVHGITTERALKEGVGAKEAVYYFLSAARVADVLVGHNVDFDMHVVGAELVRAWKKDYLGGMKVLDTMKASVDYCAIEVPGRSSYKWPKLMELHKKLFGTEFEDAHNSMADIAATEKCFWELRKLNLI